MCSPIRSHAVDELSNAGHEVTGVVTDVTDLARSRSCATRRTPPTAPFMCCATTPASARGPKAMSGTTRSTIGTGAWPSTCGASSTGSRPSSGMLREATRAHRQHLRQRRHRTLASTAIYATTKAGVTTLTEVLYGQLRRRQSPRVSVLFGLKVLRTGLLESSSKRPERANDVPRQTLTRRSSPSRPAARCRHGARLHAGRIHRRGSLHRYS
jgi:hypothetical protein